MAVFKDFVCDPSKFWAVKEMWKMLPMHQGQAGQISFLLQNEYDSKKRDQND